MKEGSELHWLASRQDLAVPILPPTSSRAKADIYQWIAEHSNSSTAQTTTFVAHFNQKADGKDYFYLTPSLFEDCISKWEKLQNRKTAQREAETAIERVEDVIESMQLDIDFESLPQFTTMSYTVPGGGQLANLSLPAAIPTSRPLAERVDPIANSSSAHSHSNSGPIRTNRPKASNRIDHARFVIFYSLNTNSLQPP